MAGAVTVTYGGQVPEPSFDPITEAHRQWSTRWPDQADRMAAVTSVMRVQQLLLSRIEDTLKPYGLTFAAYEALRLLAFSRRGSLPMGKMGERLMVHPASVTNATDAPWTSRSTIGRDTAARCQKSDSDAYGRPATMRAVSASLIPLTSDSAIRMP